MCIQASSPLKYTNCIMRKHSNADKKIECFCKYCLPFLQSRSSIFKVVATCIFKRGDFVAIRHCQFISLPSISFTGFRLLESVSSNSCSQCDLWNLKGKHCKMCIVSHPTSTFHLFRLW